MWENQPSFTSWKWNMDEIFGSIPKSIVEICKVRTSWETHKIWKNLPYAVNVQSMRKIVQIFVSFSESMKFTRKIVYYTQKMRIAIQLGTFPVILFCHRL